MVFTYCHCCRFLADMPDAAANFYRDHFIPESWALHYSDLSGCWGVFLTGRCNSCYGKLEELIPIPEGLTGDALFQSIYDTVQTAHPYDEKSDAVGYYGGCKERSEFYKRRDGRPQFQRSKEFLDLFNDWDREFARLWLEKISRLRNTQRFFGIPVAACSAALSVWRKQMGTLTRPRPSWTIICPVSMNAAQRKG